MKYPEAVSKVHLTNTNTTLTIPIIFGLAKEDIEVSGGVLKNKDLGKNGTFENRHETLLLESQCIGVNT